MQISDEGSVCCGGDQGLLRDSGILMGSLELPLFFPFPGYKARDDPRQVILPHERPGKHNCACGKRFQH